MNNRWKYYFMKSLIVLMAAAPLSAVAGIQKADAQTISFETRVSEVYANVPFVLQIVLKDFDPNGEQPQIEPFDIPGASVELLGVSPQSSSMLTIINGKRTEKREVSYVFSFQITPHQVGDYELPQIVAVQDGNRVPSGKRVSFTATDVETTTDMRLELEIPQRSLWVGESFEAVIHWYVARDFKSQNFVIPMMNMGNDFEVEEPDYSPRERTLALNAGGRSLNFPYTHERTRLNGKEYNKFNIKLKFTPIRSRTITLPPAAVHANLENGIDRNSWPFPSTQYKLYKAEDVERTITIKELPVDQKPSSFANALGENYNISVSADRTIVQAGDPVELTIDISSSSSSDGLILPKLTNCGLNEDLFGISDESPIPETIDAGNGQTIRRFKVPVRIKNERVREIPPIAFSFFNTKTEKYTTVRSQPISLTVTAADRIGVNDVIMNASTAGATASAASSNTDSERISVPVQPTANIALGLASTGSTLNHADARNIQHYLIILLYIFPAISWIAVVLLKRRSRQNSASKEQREAVRALGQALDEARNKPAREAAASISNTLSAFILATRTDRAPFADTLEKMDVEAYRPGAESKPLPENMIQNLRETVKTHTNEKYKKMVSGILAALLFFMAFSGASQEVVAQEQPAIQTADSDLDRLSRAQTAYQNAMAAKDNKQRATQFAYAASIFRDLSEQYPSDSTLLTDWGSAAFGASDFGSASLAWRRALLLDPSSEQLRTNLAYMDSMLNMDTDSDRRAVSSFFFLNNKITKDARLLWAALLFFTAAMLCIPWNDRLKRPLRTIAIFPLLAWIWLLVGVLVEPGHDNEVIVMVDSALKNADNAGASSIMQLQPGIPLTVVGERGDWVQVRTRSGTTAWIAKSSIEHI